MSPDSSRQNLKLEADTETVEDLVDLVRRGHVRVPSFQRPLRWNAEDVRALFDSVYRGYPIGSFLLRKGAAEAARIQIGPLTVDGPETQALWVVDGQQRLTALTAGLARPRPIPSTPDDPWVVYFDASAQTFETPPKSGEIPSTWVPVAEMLDASALSEWVSHWEHHTDAALRSALFQAGSRIRQYPIPVYIVETDDEQLLRDIFYRINKFGQSLRWEEVHDALFGRRGDHPSTLPELSTELQKLGMGKPEVEQLLSCVIAFKGLDVTRNVSEHYRKDSEVFTSAVQEALPAIRSTLSFLKRHAEIPHLRLLPRSIPLVILTRFFALYPEPRARTLELLTRWTWRLLLNPNSYNEQTLLRRGVSAILDSDEEKSAQQLLSLVPRERRDDYALPSQFDAGAADSRLALLGLSSLHPLSLKDGSSIDVAALIEAADLSAFRRVLPNGDRLGSSPANRILLPGSGSARTELLDFLGESGFDPEVPRSHAIPPAAIKALQKRDRENFLKERAIALERAVDNVGERLAAWSQSDRPSISYLLEKVETET